MTPPGAAALWVLRCDGGYLGEGAGRGKRDFASAADFLAQPPPKPGIGKSDAPRSLAALPGRDTRASI